MKAQCEREAWRNFVAGLNLFASAAHSAPGDRVLAAETVSAFTSPEPFKSARMERMTLSMIPSCEWQPMDGVKTLDPSTV